MTKTWLLLAAGVALALRLAGITWGFPGTYNADEPHLVHLAVSFGGGSLRPYAFKYPTLWPYLLFAAYGVYFLAWSRLGLRHGVRDFAGFYAWHPGGFYLIARLLSTAASLGACVVVWRLEKRRHPERTPWAALLLAFCPVIVEVAHSAKPDCLMFLLSSLGWAFALEVYEDGGRRAHWLSGASFGLALACQYTALPAVFALPLASLLSRRCPPRRWLLEGLAAAALALFIGAPYLFIDFGRFLDNFKDMAAFSNLKSWDRWWVMRQVVGNLFRFAGAGSIGGVAAAAGFIRLLRGDRGLAAVLMLPLVAYFVVVGNHPDGSLVRYLLGGFPALALLAAEGLSWPSRRLVPILAALALAPGIVASARADRDMRLPDTRALATRWIAEHVSPGATLLLDEPHASPQVAMERAQVEELYEKTRALGSPRVRLYREMADAHPGGGYRVLRILRSARDLGSSPAHVAKSQSESPMLDVTSGLGAARAAGVAFVVTSAQGAERAPELSRFFTGLEREADLVKTFEAKPGRVAGPMLRVFRLRP